MAAAMSVEDLDEKALYTAMKEFDSLTQKQMEENDCAKIRNFIKKVGFEKLFNIIQGSDYLMMEESKSAVSHIFKSPIGRAAISSEEMKPFLISGLTNSSERVRSFTLQQITNSLGETRDSSFIINSGLFDALLEMVGDDSVDVFESLTQLFVKCGRDPAFSALFFGPAAQQSIHSAGAGTVVVRAFLLCVSVGHESADAFREMRAAGVLESALEHLDGDDLLLKMALLEVFGEMSSSRDGLDFLNTPEMMEKLAELVLARDHGSVVAVGVVEILEKLIASSKQLNEYAWMEHDMLTIILIESVQSGETALMATALACIVQLATLSGGLEAMSEAGLLVEIPRGVLSGEDKVRLAALNGLCRILKTCFPESSPEATIQRDTFQSVGTFSKPEKPSLKIMRQFMEEPFEEMFCASCEVLRNLAKQKWGPQIFLSSGGFIEWLSNPSAPALSAKAALARKAIVQSLLANQASKDVFQSRTFANLRAFVERQPVVRNGGQVPTLTS
eukprot:78821_1